MAERNRGMHAACSGSAFLLPFLLYWFTHSSSLGFADAGEFALVTKIAGIAHPPGFPSYVLFGWMWGKLLALFSASHIVNMVLFSITCVSAASLLLYLTIRRLLQADHKNPEPAVSLVSLIGALAFCSGLTVWHWANNVEVYGFHILALAVLLYGLVRYRDDGGRMPLVAAALGLASGLANHHLTMIFFLPFIPFIFRCLSFDQTEGGRRKQTGPSLVATMRSRPFIFFAAVSAGITFLFYAWMFVRAGQEMPFKFGSPDNLSRLFYHVSGGAWQKNTARSVEGLVALRLPYFAELVWTQLFVFLPFVVAGLVALWKQGIKALTVAVVLYFLLVFVYQLRIDQTADTDAYLLPAFYLMAIPAGAGMMRACIRFKPAVYLLPLLLALQVYLHYPQSQKRDFNLSESLMTQLGRSSPPHAVLLISDWTLVSQYYYYRIAEKYRTDLVLLNYDLKFTHWKILPTLYPELYTRIRPAYDLFIKKLGSAHPQEIYNTGCTLDNRELMDAYLDAVRAIQAYCTEKGVAFLVDPKAYLLLMQYGVMGKTAYMSGFLVASTPLDTDKEFLSLPFDWLDSPLLLNEPAATDKIVDFEAALDFSRNYYRQTGDTAAAHVAEQSYQRIKQLQRRMKKNMPFVYRPRGK